MQGMHLQKCKHKGMMPNYCHAIGRVAPGNKEVRGAGIEVVLNPGRLLATTTLLQAKA